MRQLFIAPESPRNPCLLMQIFGERFGQSIRQRFGHDCAVVVVLAFEFFGELICAVDGDRKSAEIVLYRRSMTAITRRNVISQTVVELSRRFLYLLTQEIKRGDLFRSRVISVKIHIIARRVCWPKSMNASRG